MTLPRGARAAGSCGHSGGIARSASRQGPLNATRTPGALHGTVSDAVRAHRRNWPCARHNTGRIARHFRQRGLNAQPKLVLRTAITPGMLQGTVSIAVQAHHRNRPYVPTGRRSLCISSISTMHEQAAQICLAYHINAGRLVRFSHYQKSNASPQSALRAALNAAPSRLSTARRSSPASVHSSSVTRPLCVVGCRRTRAAQGCAGVRVNAM